MLNVIVRDEVAMEKVKGHNFQENGVCEYCGVKYENYEDHGEQSCNGKMRKRSFRKDEFPNAAPDEDERGKC